ncbi:ATP-binding protein [Nocardioides immobilis]|uniref:ATP-binding protein n=1 Tax=Nocardioides immobilis TaxID=2049295 RepID=A0A417XSE3_9ACTN|nr:ATP-binding protein [Nocardioides immobilis]RHW23368.1 ATP-binding protein [Nocardioides immobilis]
MTATTEAPTRTPVDELRAALETLDAMLCLRAEERCASPGGHRLTVEGFGEQLPDLDRYDGLGPLAATIAAAGLTAAEALVLVAALAPEVDERFAARYTALTDRPGVTGLTCEVARTLVARSLGGRLDANLTLSAHGTLRAAGLLVLDPPGDDPTSVLRVEPGLAAWLLGLPPAEPAVSADFPATPLRTVHTLDDVVLPARARARVADLRARIAHRDLVVEEWGFGRHHDNTAGLVALFHGPPGTGKTMTAAVIAAATGRPAYVVDLSALVSKYIGETEKSLARIFDRAARERSILVFDEADAVFGTRTEVSDAHDRYANQEVSYLLSRIEEHPGMVILTTNLLGNIDAAFRRRIHVVVEFPMPGPAERERLWLGALPPELPLAEGVDLVDLAERYSLSGAQIRDAVLEAAYLAAAGDRVVRAEELVAGVRRQYDKAGKTVPA